MTEGNMILVTERSLIYMCIGNLGSAKSSHLTICAVHVNQVWKVCRPLIHVGFGKSRFFVQTRDCHTHRHPNGNRNISYWTNANVGVFIRAWSGLPTYVKRMLFTTKNDTISIFKKMLFKTYSNGTTKWLVEDADHLHHRFRLSRLPLSAG